MQALRFFQLPRPVQDRFLDCARGTGEPTRLLFKPAVATKAWVYLALAMLLVGAAAIVANIGRGDLDSTIALAPAWLALVYGAFFSLALMLVVGALSELRTRAALPYRPGAYLFPVGVVDARRAEFHVHRMDQLASASTNGKRLQLAFQDGRRFTFTARDAESAERGRGMVQAFAEQVRQADAAHDKRALALLDPLLDTGFANPFGPDVPLKRIRPGWKRPALVAALVAGLPIGLLVWHLRNLSSEAELFAQAQAADSVEAYRTYLDRGGKRPEVEQVLLPRAKLAVARKAGTVEAIEKFLATQPPAAIQAEAQEALRTALLAELARAKQSGRVADLKKLADHPRRALLEPDLSQAIHAAYERAFEHFKKKAPDAKASALKLVEALLAYAEKHGPRVQVRFVERPSGSHVLADIAVKRSAYYGGTASVPSQYFREKHTISRETKAGASVIEKLSAAFPPDILQISMGPRLVSESEKLPKVDVPTLFILHRAELSGTYVNPNPSGVFVGVGMVLHGVFRIPESEVELRVKTSSWNRPEAKLLVKDASPGDVYDFAATAGFQAFNQKLFRVFGLEG